MAVLPSCMAVILVVFYATLTFTNTSYTEAREYGWIGKLRSEKSSNEPCPLTRRFTGLRRG